MNIQYHFWMDFPEHPHQEWLPISVLYTLRNKVCQVVWQELQRPGGHHFSGIFNNNKMTELVTPNNAVNFLLISNINCPRIEKLCRGVHNILSLVCMGKLQNAVR